MLLLCVVSAFLIAHGGNSGGADAIRADAATVTGSSLPLQELEISVALDTNALAELLLL